MLKITDDLVTGTKKEIVNYLLEKEKWFIENANPFEEMRMVSYINVGLNKLKELKLDDIAELKMYDKNDEIQFDVVE